MWILIGVRMQMVEAAEEEITARRQIVRMLETALVPRVGNMARWRRMDSCEKGRRAREHWQKEKGKNSQGKDPKTFQGKGRDRSTRERNSHSKDPRIFEENSQGEDRSIFKDPVEKWRDQEKRQEEKCKKRKKIKKKKEVKYRKRRWWKKCKESIASWFATGLSTEQLIGGLSRKASSDHPSSACLRRF